MKHKRWIRVIVVGVAYAVVGIALTEMSKRIATDQTRSWRLAAWIVSAVIYAGHFAYEQFQLKQRSLNVASTVASAVAVGAFLLAVAAAIHATMVTSHAPFWLFAIALIAWSIFTAVPAFAVTMLASALLARFK